jgi:tRNA threonylcarbamoyladenosine biosynthesis protein TsaB
VLILAVDTSSPAGSLAVLQDHTAIGTVYAGTTEPYSSRMFRQLEFLLRELSLGVHDFDLFAVGTGPGSFTGLRVGLTAVKGWAEVYGKPIAMISTLEAVAAQSHAKTKRIIPVLDARRGQVYFAAYDSSNCDLALIDSERVGTPDEFLEQLEFTPPDGEQPAVITPVPELLTNLLSRCGTSAARAKQAQLEIEEASPALAPYIGRLGLSRAKEGRITDSLKLDANYVRRSDAELHWKVSSGI